MAVAVRDSLKVTHTALVMMSVMCEDHAVECVCCVVNVLTGNYDRFIIVQSTDELRVRILTVCVSICWTNDHERLIITRSSPRRALTYLCTNLWMIHVLLVAICCTHHQMFCTHFIFIPRDFFLHYRIFYLCKFTDILLLFFAIFRFITIASSFIEKSRHC